LRAGLIARTPLVQAAGKDGIARANSAENVFDCKSCAMKWLDEPICERPYASRFLGSAIANARMHIETRYRNEIANKVLSSDVRVTNAKYLLVQHIVRTHIFVRRRDRA
ncbi:MAG: hypothetical protein ABI852_21460, partial [Gemmatimonadaceae bacterium]